MGDNFKSIGNDKLKISSDKKKENSLDYYMTKNMSNNTWWNREKKTSFSRPEDSIKKQFLERNRKATEVIPNKMRKLQETPDNLGYVNSRFGTISIGYDKYKKNSDVAFSLIPEKVRKRQNIPSPRPDHVDTYFGGEMDKTKRDFKASEITFLYDKSTEQIRKLEDKEDKFLSKDKELLYKNNKEDKRIEKLKDSTDWSSVNNRGNISQEMSSIRDVKKEKIKDNSEFINDVYKFIKKFNNGTLKKIIESDEAISRSKRMKNSSMDALDLIVLRRMIKKLIEELSDKSCLEEFGNIDIDKANKVQLETILKKLRNKIG